MSKVFFTGCTHFGHENIISLANRPFGSIDEMNDVLIQNWNSVVGPNDEVFHLGDVVYEKHGKNVSYWLSKLNGRKTIILGNHDDSKGWFDVDAGVRDVQNYYDLKRKGHRFILFHYPMEDWDGRYRGSIHLHCHTHQPVLERPLIPYLETSGLIGHSSDQPLSKSGLTLPGNYPEGLYCNRFNVTVEATNYTPISMDEILDRSVYKNGN